MLTATELVDGVWRYAPARLALLLSIAAILIRLTLIWVRRRYPLYSEFHVKQVQSSERILSRLKEIGLARGPQAQFGYLRKVSSIQFEEIILSGLEASGHQVKRNHRYTGDGGVDGQALIDGQWHLLQMKRYSSHINRKHLIEFVRLCESKKSKGLFVHSGRTGAGVARLGGTSVKVISGDCLLKFIGVSVT
jgi:restriction system protein